LTFFFTNWRSALAEDARQTPAVPPVPVHIPARRSPSGDAAFLGIGAGRGRQAPLQSLHRTVIAWIKRARQRHALLPLGDSMLRDIGLELERERKQCAIPFRLPR
jgi:uncharacterized protein YjiS (DUF1127 family)